MAMQLQSMYNMCFSIHGDFITCRETNAIEAKHLEELKAACYAPPVYSSTN